MAPPAWKKKRRMGTSNMTTDSSFQQREADLIRDDIEGYLRQHEQKDMLRFLTAGSVDDGKSTLIGRLLYDSKMIYEDQLAAVVKDSAVHGTTNDDFDPALLTDGLKAEREQPTATSRPISATSSFAMRPDTSSTRATWRPGPRTAISRLS
jgi:hypothetical protein